MLLVDAQVFPQTLAVMHTRAVPLRPRRSWWPTSPGSTSAEALRAAAGGPPRSSACSCSTPALTASCATGAALTAAAHDAGALVTAAADLLALTLATPPGEWGADVAVGTTQRFGVPMGFGGPHAGYMSVRAGLERTLAGPPRRGVGRRRRRPGLPAGPADP